MSSTNIYYPSYNPFRMVLLLHLVLRKVRPSGHVCSSVLLLLSPVFLWLWRTLGWHNDRGTIYSVFLVVTWEGCNGNEGVKCPLSAIHLYPSLARFQSSVTPWYHLCSSVWVTGYRSRKRFLYRISTSLNPPSFSQTPIPKENPQGL